MNKFINVRGATLVLVQKLNHATSNPYVHWIELCYFAKSSCAVLVSVGGRAYTQGDDSSFSVKIENRYFL